MNKTKNCVQLDSEGYFLGATVADESPLEPGQYLMPAHALDIALPPRFANANETVRWNGYTWLYEPDYSEETLYSIEDGSLLPNVPKGKTLNQLNATLKRPQSGQIWDLKKQAWTWTLELLKEQKLAELAAVRWNVQCAGVHVDGVEYASSPDDVARLKSAIEDAQLLSEEIIAFKAQNGFIEASVEELQNAYKAIVKHTQRCYQNEKGLSQQIELLELPDDVQNFDCLNGWLK